MHAPGTRQPCALRRHVGLGRDAAAYQPLRKARVQAAGPPTWLIQGVWPRDAYGVFAAEDKAGKTWAMLDLACSVAAGVPWLGHFACPPSGPVLK